MRRNSDSPISEASLSDDGSDERRPASRDGANLVKIEFGGLRWDRKAGNGVVVHVRGARDHSGCTCIGVICKDFLSASSLDLKYNILEPEKIKKSTIRCEKGKLTL